MRILNIIISTFLLFFNVTSEDLSSIKYIPLGESAVFECEAYTLLKEKVDKINNVHWQYFGKSIKIKQLGLQSEERFQMNSSYFLTGYNIQRSHIGTFECIVEYTKYEKESVLRSSVNLEIQDCYEDSNSTQLSDRNPCQYGACIIEKNNITSNERLRCECVEQYSGIYCEDEVRGTWWRELSFYSPIIGHFAVAALVLFFGSFYAKVNNDERVSLSDDTPLFGRINLSHPRRFPAKDPPSQVELNDDLMSLMGLLQKIHYD